METIDRELRSKLHNLDKDPEKISQTIAEHILTPEAYSKGHITVEIGNKEGFQIRAIQIPLDWYCKRNHITKEEYRAGERIYRDFFRAGRLSKTTASMSDVRHEQQFLNATEAQRDAYLSYRAAMNAVNGILGKLMILNVCCLGEWLKDMNYMPYTNKQSMPRFKEALNDLMNFYKIANDAIDTRLPRSVQSSHDELNPPVASNCAGFSVSGGRNE